MSSVFTVTTKNTQGIKCLFGADVYLKQPAVGVSYYARRLTKSRLSQLVKIIVKFVLQAF